MPEIGADDSVRPTALCGRRPAVVTISQDLTGLGNPKCVRSWGQRKGKTMILETYNYDNGLTVNVMNEECADNPHEMIDCQFSGIVRNERNSVESDQYGIMAEYDRICEDIERAECDNDSDAVAGLRDELSGYRCFTMQATNEYGWPEFRIVVDKDKATEITGFKPDADKTWAMFAQGIVDSFAAWTEGSVYCIRAEYPNGDIEYLPEIYTDDSCCPDKDMCEEYAREIEPAGAYDICPDDSPATVFTIGQIRDAVTNAGLSENTAGRIVRELNGVA